MYRGDAPPMTVVTTLSTGPTKSYYGVVVACLPDSIVEVRERLLTGDGSLNSIVDTWRSAARSCYRDSVARTVNELSRT
jgi:hypothetical protein